MELGFRECLSMPAQCAVFWAGWGTIASAAVGLVTVLVAVMAWLTSRRAAEIAKEATRIAKQQHEEALALRRETARIVGRLLLFEVTELPARVGAIVRAWEAAVDWRSLNIRNDRAFQRTLDEASLPFLSGAEQVQERIHTLPDALGADLAAFIGAVRSLNDMARRMSAKVSMLRSPAHLGGDRSGYAGSHDDFTTLREQLRWHLHRSIEFAGEFQTFAGIEPTDYSEQLDSLSPIP